MECEVFYDHHNGKNLFSKYKSCQYKLDEERLFLKYEACQENQNVEYVFLNHDIYHHKHDVEGIFLKYEAEIFQYNTMDSESLLNLYIMKTFHFGV